MSAAAAGLSLPSSSSSELSGTRLLPGCGHLMIRHDVESTLQKNSGAPAPFVVAFEDDAAITSTSLLWAIAISSSPFLLSIFMMMFELEEVANKATCALALWLSLFCLLNSESTRVWTCCSGSPRNLLSVFWRVLPVLMQRVPSATAAAAVLSAAVAVLTPSMRDTVTAVLLLLLVNWRRAEWWWWSMSQKTV